MPTETQSRETTFGYLSTVHTPDYGYFGGYLLISHLGRPLEFHCTSPVQPSRAQEILYGPTLQAFLLGEQIGGSLLQAAKLKPQLILTDQAALLAVRPRAGVPMVMMVANGGDDRSSLAIQSAAASNLENASICPAANSAPHWQGGRLIAGGFELQAASGFEPDREAVAEGIAILVEHVELAEPFGRIHEAIREAQRIDGRSIESHGEAA